jgi:hypothetical protein
MLTMGLPGKLAKREHYTRPKFGGLVWPERADFPLLPHAVGRGNITRCAGWGARANQNRARVGAPAQINQPGWVGALSEDDARRHGDLAFVRGREPAQHVEPEAGDVELIPLLERAALSARLIAGLTVARAHLARLIAASHAGASRGLASLAGLELTCGALLITLHAL